jgi:hypothetical protein
VTKPYGEHVNCEHDPEGADGNPFAAMICAPMPELSTSALLRQTQAALAASQADLTRVEQERDQANELTDGIARQLRLVTRERDSLARRCGVRFEEAQALRAELATTQDELAKAVELAARARAERDTRTSWQVARADYGLTCGECAAPIVRGQAVEPQPGTTHGTWIHVACPTRS